MKIKPSTIPGQSYSEFKDLSSLDAVKMEKNSTIREDGYNEEQSLLNCFEEFMRLYERGWVNH